ncbi:MAG: winged helix-turn-helix domain-containing protein [Clostridia bacterium]|nr:winged helix-turn-helix domain-containing protein [Clostridia bacterium]
MRKGDGVQWAPAAVHVASTIEELRALLDRRRIAALKLLAEEPLSVKQLADRLQLMPASLHYHVKVLERAGLVKLVHTKEKSGIVEKRYQAVARDFVVHQSLGGAREAPGIALEAITRDIRGAIECIEDANERDHVVNAQLINVPMSREVATCFAERLAELAEEFRASGDENVATVYSMALAVYPTSVTGGDPTARPEENRG